MHLKSIELFGFKSFADRTLVEFHKGITAIVGPNGCGKSNVLDALRWVLGEQSAKALRGGEMTDVIFNGTDDRKPLNMAEVSVTFADCEEDLGVEWAEVRVTRRVFRDGKSEYLLNNVACRLRDIQNLFMDTGIGRNAYSIMEQGKISQILSSRPEDRRTVFEEAAGITRFKSQKKEALRKLDHTEGNLIRVNDVMREVKRQIGSLQRQAAKARRYKSMHHDLQVLDTHLHKNRHDHLAQQAGELQASLNTLGDSRQTFETNLTGLEDRFSGHRAAMQELEAAITQQRQQIQDARNSIQNAESKIGFNRERIQESRDLIQRYTAENDEAKLKQSEYQRSLQDLLSMATSEENLLQTEALRLSGQENEARQCHQARVQLESRLDELRNQITQAEKELFAQQNEVNQSAHLRETLGGRLAGLTQNLDALGTSLEQLTQQEATTRVEREEQERQHSTLQEDIVHLKQRVQEQQHVQQAAASKQRSLQQKIQATEIRRDTLVALNNQGEGLGPGAQKLLAGLTQKDFFQPSVLGSLPTLIEVEDGWVPAVEAALGPQLQSIILDSPDTLEQLLGAIERQGLERTVLAPLGWHQEPAAGVDPDGARPALDAVRCESPLRPLVAGLLKNIYLVETVQEALQLKNQWRTHGFVTRKGDFFSPEGLIHTRVETDPSQSILQRKNEITRLDEEERELHHALGEQNSIFQQCETSLADLRVDLDVKQGRAQELQLSGKAMDKLLTDWGQQIHGMLGKREQLSREAGQCQEQQKAVEERVDKANLTIKTLQERIETARHERESFAHQLDQARSAESQASNQLSELKVLVATMTEKISGLANQRAPIESRLRELQALSDQRNTDITNYQNRITQLTEDNEKLAQSIDSTQVQLGDWEKQLNAHLEQRQRQQEQGHALEGEIKEVRKYLDDARGKLGQTEVKQTQVTLKLQSLQEYAQRRYQIDLDLFENDTYSLLKTLDGIKKSKARGKNEGSGESEDEPSDSERVSDAQVEPDTSPEREADLLETADLDANQDSDTPNGPQLIDWEQVEKFTTELSRRIEQLGPVNLESIEEFAELEERHEFLDQQHQDLVNAKAELLEAINRINRTTEELFAETFEKLREHFQVMFRELFGGGKADLALMNADDPLECGIEIIAKPPGKQPQALSLLSGGESAMTAVALLFAIFMVKPSPFCVLDEMDAPLDDSNISRFIKILEQFSQNSQFVVISHNKRTIARSDYLYGVTMERKGISKLVGVRFAKAEEPQGAGVVASAQDEHQDQGISGAMGKSDRLLSEEMV
ncbi:MAG: chromosome segregation protein SMC [Verrucomicrobiales bacterium]